MKKTIFVILCSLTNVLLLAQSNYSAQEKEYLDFLYQYMPLSDRADYDTAFFAKQVQYAIKTKQTFAWTKQIPEQIFKSFVLVYRVNNENLDTARIYMFNALKDRVKGLTMYEAALEVNHWCHEKVNYKASDGRTSAPLSTLRTSWGRCGEESTFAVTALRSVGIPARQCYTPRWAHTDDNHAWVEVWIDGTWYHLGACEPEAKLNYAWFDAPSKRAMMVHTTVFGNYEGKEEKNFVADKYSKINLLSNYAPTKKLTIKVIDQNTQQPINNAEVSFGLYNYAEYYPLAKLYTDQNGITNLTTGYGDLIIWAKTDKYFNQKQAFATDTFLTITLGDNVLTDNEIQITPPKPLPIQTIDEQLAQLNNIRLVREDSIRNSYINTFVKTDNPLIRNSWGNYKDIQAVLNTKHPLAEKMLSLVYEKDLRDVDSNTFIDFLNNTKSTDTSVYILNPRIQLEKITPYKSDIKSYFSKGFNTVQDIIQWINDSIQIDNKDNYYGVPISPKGILRLKKADNKSKEIFFVAIARTYSIEARYEWATGRAQYRNNSTSDWQYAFTQGNRENKNCILILNNAPVNTIKPEYYSQFTLQQLVTNSFVTLDYEYDPHFLSFPDTISLQEGVYRIVAGNRNSEGKVFVKEKYFSLSPTQPTTITLTIPQAKEDINIYGTSQLKGKLHNIVTNQKQDIESIVKKHKACIVAVIDPYKEPSRHLLVDISKSRLEFDNHKDVALILILDKSLLNKDFSTKTFPELNTNTYILIDNDKKIEKQILSATKQDFLGNYPILTLIKNNGDFIYFSQGYKISSQEELLKNINKLK